MSIRVKFNINFDDMMLVNFRSELKLTAQLLKTKKFIVFFRII